MTSAYTVDNRGETMLDESNGNTSTVLDFGSGHVHPTKAMDPGLVYDITTMDYIDFLCNSNYTINNIRLVFRRVGQKLNFLVRVQTVAVKLSPGGTSMQAGSIVWSDGKHEVVSTQQVFDVLKTRNERIIVYQPTAAVDVESAPTK
ncbi:hypothetical protein Gotri_003531 [Gossypium trilobum]|uniref:Subtilisin-like protease fibronectin type-III domain-containing protein n=1 Tax=Gossypium trilobum TaxID=34281 RepID=A0A7J9F1T1_9ROSI|nr:hypothetical protein [Gossypium trilobum]